jgi:segregation and condensation protein B
MSEELELTPKQQPIEGEAGGEVAAPEAGDESSAADCDVLLADSGITEIPAEGDGESGEFGGRLSAEPVNRLFDGSGLPGIEPAGEGNNGEQEAGEVAPARLENELTSEQVVEAILFAAATPLGLSKIVSILGVGSARDVRKHINALNKRYEQQGTAFRIEAIAGGYQMLTRPEFNTWLRRLKQSKQDSRLSQAAMETLAVVAYKQPVVRADIEAIRGVQSGEMLNRLRELGLVKIVGRAEDVGRPMLYGTTKRFLEIFGLSGLDDLPEVEELKSDE